MFARRARHIAGVGFSRSRTFRLGLALLMFFLAAARCFAVAMINVLSAASSDTSNGSAGHFLALFRAAPTGLGTALAMIAFVLLAFSGTGIANFSADRADGRREP